MSILSPRFYQGAIITKELFPDVPDEAVIDMVSSPDVSEYSDRSSESDVEIDDVRGLPMSSAQAKEMYDRIESKKRNSTKSKADDVDDLFDGEDSKSTDTSYGDGGSTYKPEKKRRPGKARIESKEKKVKRMKKPSKEEIKIYPTDFVPCGGDVASLFEWKVFILCYTFFIFIYVYGTH